MQTARCLVSLTLLLLLGLVCSRSSIWRNTAAESRPALAGAARHQLSAGEVPSGLSAGDWQDIRKQIIRYRHRVQSAPGEPFRAVNPGQQIHASFSEDGIWVEPSRGNWGWGLRLKGAGSKELSGPPEGIWAEGNRVYTRWDASLTEWLENGERGLEQGFTLARRPTGLRDGQPLILGLAVRGGLAASSDPGGREVVFRDPERQTRLTYGELHVVDAKGSSIPARLEGSGQAVRIVIDDRRAIYPLTVDPLIQQAYLKASNTGTGDEFSRSVAVYRDTVVVGAPYESSSATGMNSGGGEDNSTINAGAAYVFVRNNGVWTQQAYLKASNTGAEDRFGYSVAIDEDTVVIAAPGESSSATGVNGDEGDDSATYAGAVYVFVRSGGTWTQQAYLKASNTEAMDEFGYSVDISGSTIVVGARLEDSNSVGVDGDQSNNAADLSGSAYVFIRTGGAWAQQAYLKASNTGAHDQFGVSVAASGDTVVVGAFLEDSNSKGVNGNGLDDSMINSGAAYVFVRSGTTWSQQAYLKASNTGAGDRFGGRVAIFGETVVVGAPDERSNTSGVNGDGADDSALVAGAAYVFVRNNGAWTQQAYLKASNTEAGDCFGFSVGISEDMVVVGAIGEDSAGIGVNDNEADNSAPDSGAVYVFIRSGGTWTQQAYLKASNTETGDQFGYFLAISEDTVVIGAPDEDGNARGVNGDQSDNSASSSGAAYVVTLNPDLRVSKTNSVNGMVLLGDSYVWTLSVTNHFWTAHFFDGQTILNDMLPEGINYGNPSVGSINKVVNGNQITCALVSGTFLTCTATGGDVTLDLGGGFVINVTATPTATGVFTNPAVGGQCRVDPDNHIPEFDETNNDCNSDSVMADPRMIYLPVILK